MEYITLSGLERLDADVIRLFLLELDPTSVAALCSSSKKLHEICKDPHFRKKYKEIEQDNTFRKELKGLLLVYGLYYYPLRASYVEFVHTGIEPTIALQMAAEKEVQKAMKDPDKVGYIADAYPSMINNVTSDYLESWYKMQDVRVGMAAELHPTRKPEAEWLRHRKYVATRSGKIVGRAIKAPTSI